jgi:hypothetical protein
LIKNKDDEIEKHKLNYQNISNDLNIFKNEHKEKLNDHKILLEKLQTDIFDKEN